MIKFPFDEEKYFDKCQKNQNFPKNDAFKQIILKRIIANLEYNKTYSEDEIDRMIFKYFKDFSLIRRELVNFGYISRNPHKGIYKLLKKELSEQDYKHIKRLSIHATTAGIFINDQ